MSNIIIPKYELRVSEMKTKSNCASKLSLLTNNNLIKFLVIGCSERVRKAEAVGMGKAAEGTADG